MTHRCTVSIAQTLIGFLLTSALPMASAATFSVNPIRVELDAHHRADILTFNNSGDAPLRMQIRSMHWSAAADGQWQLIPTDDLIVTPELLEVAPGHTAQLRVGSLLDVGASEASYRLLIDELPNLSENKSTHRAEIRVLTQVSLPVFVEPAQATRLPALSSASIEHGVLVVGMGNGGTQRLDPQSVKVTVTDRTGQVLGQHDLIANYVLPGSTWFLHTKLPATICPRAASVSVSWPSMANTSLAHSITTGAEACEGTSSP
jgi:fimbrial chaperone protein